MAAFRWTRRCRTAPRLTIDASVYRTALDLSKPLPPRWSISQLQQPVPAAAAGLLAIVVLGLGLAGQPDMAAAPSRRGGSTPCRIGCSRRRCCAGCITPGGPWPLPRLASCLPTSAGEHGPTEVVAYITGVLVLAFLAMGARVFLARSWRIAITQEERGHQGWRSAWSPERPGCHGHRFPLVRADGKDSLKVKVHLAAPITLAALSALLFRGIGVAAYSGHRVVGDRGLDHVSVHPAAGRAARWRSARQNRSPSRSGRPRGRLAGRPGPHLSPHGVHHVALANRPRRT